MKILSALSKIAWRNLLRNKRRTGLLMAALSFGACCLILVGGFLDDLMVHMREDFIHTQTGHIQISRAGYAQEGSSSPMDYSIANFSALRKELQGMDHVVEVVPRLKLLGVASAGDSSLSVQLIGVDSAAEARMGGYRHTEDSKASFDVSEGRNLHASDQREAIAGKSLLKSLSLKLGSDINFLTVRKEGALDGTEFSLVGSFVTFMKAFDERTIFVPLSAAQRLLGSPDTVTYALLLLDRTENTEKSLVEIQQWIRSKHLPFEALAWHEQAEYYHQCRLFLDSIFRSVMLLFAAIFAFTLYNMISMAIQERNREFGTMMALGNDRNWILGMILLEAVYLGAIGAVLGAILGIGFGTLISWIGIPMPPPPQGSEAYQALIALSPSLILKTMGLTLTSCVLGAILPALRSSRKRIVAALGYV